MLTFPPNPKGSGTSILARVGVSYISSDQACANAESEIPDFDFDGTRQASFDEWNELLGRIQVDTTNVDSNITEVFYSSVRALSYSTTNCCDNELLTLNMFVTVISYSYLASGL